MKNSLKILLALSVLAVGTANAKMVDLKGSFLPDDELYKSGDVYTNISNDVDYFGFHTNAGDLFYPNMNNMKSRIAATYVPSYANFKTDMYGYNVFGFENDKRMDLTIPTFYGNNVYWTTNYGSESAKASSYYALNLEPALSEVKYNVECDKDEVNIGDGSNCKVYVDWSYYVYKIGRDIVPRVHELEITSNDYIIKNLKGNVASEIKTNGNKVTATIIDNKPKKKVLPEIPVPPTLKDGVLSAVAYPEEDEDYIEYQKYVTFEPTCLNPTGEYYEREIAEEDAMEYRLNDLSNENLERKILPFNCEHDVSLNYKIELVSFEIEPKEDADEKGTISLSNVKTKLSTTQYGENGYEEVMLDTLETEEVENNVPIVGLVKGVEEVTENPKTGLLNYIYLIIPMILFTVLYYNTIEKKCFKYNDEK